MRIILSRKGFDSKYGGIPSPVLPDGTLLSFPIPSLKDSVKYSELFFNNKSYLQIINELNPKTKIKDNYYCHLDPDLRKEVTQRNKHWKPLYGQTGTALRHLINKKVKEGDIFLFFGWLKKTEMINNNPKYKIKASDLHIIYGYFQIKKIFLDVKRFPLEFSHHPHADMSKYSNNNCIFDSTETLSILPELPGSGALKYNKKLVLTKAGETRSKWKLPPFFKDVKISYHTKKSWKDDYFQSAAIGQEFVVNANNKIIDWAKDIIKAGHF